MLTMQTALQQFIVIVRTTFSIQQSRIAPANGGNRNEWKYTYNCHSVWLSWICIFIQMKVSTEMWNQHLNFVHSKITDPTERNKDLKLNSIHIHSHWRVDIWKWEHCYVNSAIIFNQIFFVYVVHECLGCLDSFMMHCIALCNRILFIYSLNGIQHSFYISNRIRFVHFSSSLSLSLMLLALIRWKM